MPHAPCKVTFDLLTLKVVSESRVTWPTSVPILVLLGLSVLDLKVKVNIHTFDIAPLRSESRSQKCSVMARVHKGFHSFTYTPTRSSAIGMSHTCLCLPSYNWYLFTDPGGMED